MNDNVKAIPDGFHVLTPHVVVRDTAAAIEFYSKAFGAVEIFRMPEPDGTRIMHALVRIGDSMMMLADTFAEYGSKNPEDLSGSPVVFNIYCDNVDEVVESAAANGAKVNMPPTDMFWGDRYAKLTDPFGHEWSVATHIKDMTEEEMMEGAKKAFSEGCPAQQ